MSILFENAIARLPGIVHGVVVQITTDAAVRKSREEFVG